MPYSPAKPPKEALDYLRGKKLKPSFDYRDVWKEEHGYAFTIAKATKIDVLEVFSNAIDQALAEGRTLAQFAKDITPTLQKLGWWGEKEQVDPITGDVRTVQLGSPRRLKTIYQSNMRSARAAGQWERIQRTKRSLPYLLYELGPSREHRPEHEQWAGTILPVDDPFWQTHFAPNGYGCKCRQRALTKRAAAKLGGVTERPATPTKEWVNKRTGEVEQVPVGIDPGWSTNPGLARKAYIEKLVAQKLKATNPDIARAVAADLIDSPSLVQFLNTPKREKPK